MKSLYFDEFSVGQTFRSPRAREVTEETINAFAELSGDKNRLHLDEAFAQRTPFGGRIAHGLLGCLHDMGRKATCKNYKGSSCNRLGVIVSPHPRSARYRGMIS